MMPDEIRGSAIYDSECIVCIARSRFNELLFVALIVATAGVRYIDHFVASGITLWNLLLALATVRQGLDTYIRRTLFREEELQHRTMLGRTHILRYTDLNVVEYAGERLVVTGNGVEFVIRRRDGNFDTASELLHRKVLRVLKIPRK